MSAQASKFPCPHCTEGFDYKMELDMHIGKRHRDKITAQQPFKPTILTQPPNASVKPQATQQEELIVEYSLAESKQGLGELCPVLKDKDGNIIDGFHRKGENQNWREETLDWIDTPVKLELARLAVNFNRRRVTPQELTERITFLIEAGVSVEEISKATGISTRTIYKYKPAGLKNPVKVASRSTKVELNSTNFDEAVHQTVNTHDNSQKASPTSTELAKPSPNSSKIDDKSPTKNEDLTFNEDPLETPFNAPKVCAQNPTLNDTKHATSFTVKIRTYKPDNEMLPPRIIEDVLEDGANFDEYHATLEDLTKQVADGQIGGFIVEKGQA